MLVIVKTIIISKGMQKYAGKKYNHMKKCVNIHHADFTI